MPQLELPIAWDRYSYGKNNPIGYSDPTGHCFFGGVDTLICAIVAGVVAITAGMDLIEEGALITNQASTDPKFTTEQYMFQSWQNNCRNICHNNETISGFSTANKPEIPLTDLYSSGMVDVFNGIGSVSGGIAGLSSLNNVNNFLYRNSSSSELLNFASDDLLVSHFSKHRYEFGYQNADEYLEGARNLINGGSDVELYIRPSDNARLFYRKKTNEFAVLHENGVIGSYFKPKYGIFYWLREIGR